MTPEQEARQQIDALLEACGWAVQDYRRYDPSQGPGVALREAPMKAGFADYLLIANRRPVGIIEAKKPGTHLSGVVEQSAFYGQNLPDLFQGSAPLRFYYESTGVETFFRDAADPAPRSRRVFAFHRPETLAEWQARPDTLRARLQRLPPLATAGMRACQVEAITALERSLAADQPRSLIQMATGAGKTFTACAFTYRLIAHAGARRVLFLVDRANLGRQAKTEFEQFTVPDSGRKLTELYNVQHLLSNALDPVCRVTICTIQRLYSMLRGEELAEDIDEVSGFELAAADGRPREVRYNPALPIETFDVIVTDECHRSIYNLWRQVLEYFDAHLIGLTATPSKQTIGFFNQNLVMEYGHDRAVTDRVNVGYDVYRIRTAVTEQGATVEKGYYVDRRSRETRALRWERLDEDLTYAAAELDRSVVVPSQIRTVLETFRDALAGELFPGRALVPKTLIFAKDDSHAEDVVHICREVFGRGNDFCKKITYKAYNPETRRYEKSEHLIQEFRTSPHLRIAVTVDMIATGTDIKPLECLLFLRDVRSRVYFEQMKGRGTRVLSPTELQAVSGADARVKDHFVIVDAVGVCESDKTDSRPLDRQPTVKLDKLLLGVALGKRDEDALTTLAARLARLDCALDPGQRRQIAAVAGAPPAALSATLLRAVDPDAVAERAGGGADEARLAAARAELIAAACAPFERPAVRDALLELKRVTEQTIDVVTRDRVTERGFSAAAREQAERHVQSFRAYIDQHRAEIAALQILYSRPYAQRLTEAALKELEQKLAAADAQWTPERLADAYRQLRPDRVRGQLRRFTDLVSLVRFALEQEPVLEPFAAHVERRFAEWLAAKSAAGVTFTADQRAWLEKMRDYVIASGSVDRDHLEADNVLGPMYGTFGERLWALMDELNLALAA
ncbi:DEAD/DEAH box helicase family protein [bacterium]|nr:DEAD/DEAH box helicase family protein [bacterium]